jgi:hypothetical protein
VSKLAIELLQAK